jgi:NADH-quinone oxidoreductase subunit E
MNYEESRISRKFDYSVADSKIKEFGDKPNNIIAVLQGIQKHYRYLPKEIFPYLSEKMNISEAKIFGIATFYENFSLDPKGKFVIKICDGTACHVRKSIPIFERIKQDLKLEDGQVTTKDMLFTVETVSCLGACSLAPVVMVNDEVYAEMSPDKVSELIAELKEAK